MPPFIKRDLIYLSSGGQLHVSQHMCQGQDNFRESFLAFHLCDRCQRLDLGQQAWASSCSHRLLVAAVLRLFCSPV